MECALTYDPKAPIKVVRFGETIAGLQKIAEQMRMIPVSTIFRRQIRLVHQLCLGNGKKATLKFEGEKTELDKDIIDAMFEPMIHNAVDHGIEMPSERISVGKPEMGTITLLAGADETSGWIAVEDDGRGLDRSKILSAAVAKGLVDSNVSNMKDDEVTDISGCGVGLDAVKKKLEGLGCDISVDSEAGLRTRFTIHLPRTGPYTDPKSAK